MENVNTEIINAAKNLLYNIHKGQMRNIYNLCANNVLWKFNHNYSKGIKDKSIITGINTIIAPTDIMKIEHIQNYIFELSKEQVIVTGIYCVYASENIGTKNLYFDYTIIFINGLACYVQIFGTNVPTKIHKITSITEAVHFMQEAEIMYIEAMGDHIIWHCRNITIESIGTLKNIEATLSKDFIRVHRSYIVNKTLVTSIQRCSATIINGDIIPISYKRYVQIKKQLLLEFIDD